MISPQNTLTSPHEFAARAVAADVEQRLDVLTAEAEQGHEPAMMLLGSYYLWRDRKPLSFLPGEWLVQNAVCYVPAPKVWDWPVTGELDSLIHEQADFYPDSAPSIEQLRDARILIDHQRADTTIRFIDSRGEDQ